MSEKTLTNINQKDYLKKYLSGPNKDKKKQRKTKKSQQDVRSTSKTKIIDDDFTLNKIDEYGRISDEEFGEDAPQIAAIIDERPPHLQGKWKTLDERNEQALQNVQNIAKEGFSESSTLILRKRKDSDNDLSPPRLKDTSYSRNSNLLLRNERRHDSDSDLTPPRNRKKSFSDKMPAVLTKQDLDDVSLRRNRKRHDSDSDMSPPRNRKRNDLDTDMSHPRSRKNDDSGNVKLISGNRKPNFSDDKLSSKFRRRHDLYRITSSPRNKKRYDSDNDVSPPRNRKVRQVQTRRSSSPEYLKTVKHEKQRHDSDSDTSSERHGKISNPLSSIGSKRQSLESSVNIRSSHHKKHDSDSDSDVNSSSNRKKDEQEESQHHGVRASETLSGLKAGLQHGTSLRDELQSAKEREKELLKNMGSHSGKDAETVFRDRETGKKRDLKEERRQKRKEAEKIAEQQEKYLEWGRGLKQTADKKSQLEQDLYEMSKPLARYEDDPDLEKHLKEQEREGDPMLEFIRKRKAKQTPEQQTRPKYKGPPAPPNRFGIPPGYRWDGVDRSNGFEKKMFERTSSKMANQEEAYKWSVSDM